MQLLLHYLRPYTRRITGGTLMKLLGTLMELFLPWLLARMLGKVQPDTPLSFVYGYGGFMLFCSIGAWFTNVFANQSAAAVARDFTRCLRHDLFGKITRLTAREIDRFTIPSLISRMTTDTYYIHRMIGMVQRIGIRAPILLIGGIALTLSLDPVLSGLLVAMLPFMALVVWLISKKGVPLYSKLQESVDTLVRIVRENLTGFRIIKALSKTEDEKKRFAAINTTVAAEETRAGSAMAINAPMMKFLLNMGLVLVVAVGAVRVSHQVTEPAAIIAFLSYFTIILNAMLSITRILTMYSKALASARRIQEVFDGQEEKPEGQDAAASASAPHVEFRHVTFSYDQKLPNLEDISFTLQKGQRLGILGPTGAGKSTLIKLLLRLYSPDQGEILIDGSPLEKLSLASLRSRFGVVFQNDALFRGNLKENITLGRCLSMDEIEKALADAQASFAYEKGGMEAEVLARGQNFSGGQQQRLLLARALAGNPDILILDDSSSALDFKTEAALRSALNQGYAGTTVITIAQRISAIMHCDQILVLEEGRALGLGTHEELMERCPLYREIAELQLGGGENE